MINELYTGMNPLDIVLTWRSQVDDQERTLIVEIDGKVHYYSDRDRHLNQRTDFKYRMYDLYGLTYTRISCFDHMTEDSPNTHEFYADSVIEDV